MKAVVRPETLALDALIKETIARVEASTRGRLGRHGCCFSETGISPFPPR